MPKSKKTDQERLAELQQRQQNLAIRMAKKGNTGRENLDQLAEHRSFLAKEVIRLSRGFFAGPQSFDARIEKHQAWIEKIEQERDTAEEKTEQMREDIAKLDETIAQVALDPSDNRTVEDVLGGELGELEA